MLEVVHLTKIYKAKGGVETKALNDVSVRFPETGMVFLLGKSGSGKSTLLNVCGGLDAPTSGEVIVKGRSSKNFSQSDFDSYRNTFIGFVFQEYNILNEFTVEDNIALALELQGKPKDKKAIKQLLDDVDLSSFAKRKPNTLSGGQKQRIAIARALIKHPEIIMADEPTGALDSNTGKQVFDTLKKLSKTKLVIVVSHDRDSAEEYGDRIIELKDGKILSDVTKAEAKAQAVGENIELLGDNTLSVKDGAALTQADYQYIYSFLSRNKNAIISSGEKEISDFKKVSHITENGGKEYFAETDEKQLPKKNYDGKSTKFIRSKLPMRHAFKIGVSGLKAKPFRLIFTVLLCAVAFIMFGLFSTLMLYDNDETLYQTLNDSGVNVLHVDKAYCFTETSTYSYDGESNTYSYEQATHTRLTESEIEKIAKTFGDETFGVTVLSTIFTGWNPKDYYHFSPSSVSIDNVSLDAGAYYKAELLYAGYLPENHAFRAAKNTGIGAYPAADDEVWISSYLASVLVKANYEGADSAQKLVGKKISFQKPTSGGDTKAEWKISGIFDSGDQALSSKYKAYQEKNVTSIDVNQQRTDMQNLSGELTDGYHEIAFFTENTANSIRKATKSQNPAVRQELNDSYSHRASFAKLSDEDDGYYNEFTYYRSSLIPALGNVTWLNGSTSAANGEAVADIRLLANAFNVLSRLPGVLANECSSENYFVDEWEIQNWLSGNTIPDRDNEPELYSAYQTFLTLTGAGGRYETEARNYNFSRQSFAIPAIDGATEHDVFTWLQFAADRYLPGYDNSKDMSLTEEQAVTIATEILNRYSVAYGDFTVKAQVLVQSNDGPKLVGEVKSFKVAGVLISSAQNYGGAVCISDSDYAAFSAISNRYNEKNYSSSTYEINYKEPENALYDAVFLPYSSAHRNDLSMFSSEFGEDDSKIVIGNAQAQNLEMVNITVKEMSKVFMWIGIVLAAFSMLLLSNFIATSISYKKKEIGILRAVGARGADVFKIFYSESFVIALICLVLGIAGSIVGCNILNGEVGSTIGASIFVFGGTSVAILLGIAAVTSAIATFLPVFTAARKKPVEAIRAL